MAKQSAVSVAAELPPPGKEVATSSTSSGGVKLEDMVLTLEDLKELGEEKLKSELRARGKDFRGKDVSELAARLLRVVTVKQRIRRKGNYANDSNHNDRNTGSPKK